MTFTLPDGIIFPHDGKVVYVVPGALHRELHLLDRGPQFVRFENTVHLNDGSPEAGGFYLVGVRALDNAPLGLAWGRLEIGTTTAPLRFQITPHRPTGNLIGNGGFDQYAFKPDGKWYDNKGVTYAKNLRQLTSWKVGAYEGKGVWRASPTGEPGTFIDLIQGNASANFPEDPEYPFAPGENIVDINGAKSCGFIEQTVPVTPGSWYELSFYTGYHFLRDPITAPTYLRAEVLAGDPAPGTPVVWDDYIHYYSGKGASATDAGKKLNAPGWRKRRLRFQAPAGADRVTVRFANPGRAGFDKELSANPDGDTGMLLAHIRLSPAPSAP
ncbi:hypothetical protein [Streptomyces sp. NPDC048196]|uniref:hypothetical protein n=1 Tax=Streptomyces sp. NPDC048196 TaxID=3154712 RepID=UPI0033FC287E